MPQVYFADINTSADSINGNGSQSNAYNYSQFMNILAVNDETTDVNYFYLRGYRDINSSGTSENPITADNIWMLSKKNVYIYSWGDDPWVLNCSDDFYLESYVDWFEKVTLRNGIIKHNPLYLKFSLDTGVFVCFENCWMNGNFDDSDNYYSGGKIYFRNSTLCNFKIENRNFNEIHFVNSIIYNSTSNDYFLCQNTAYTNYYFDNVVSNRNILNQSLGNAYNVLNPDTVYGLDSTYEINLSADVENSWDASDAVSVFSTDVGDITKEDISYISNAFSAIDINGNKDSSYDYTWFGGKRDGVGALYFPEISSVNISASNQSPDVDVSVSFVFSGTPFASFGISSATYNFDDGNTSAVNSNEVLEHSYFTNGGYQPYATIKSKNNWYEYTTDVITIIVGSFAVIIKTYDVAGNDITNSSATFFDDLTISAFTSGATPSSYIWDFGDNTSGSNVANTKYYTSANTYTISVSAYSSIEGVSATDTATIDISAISNIYYVNITSAYDVCASNNGTSLDPFNWNEFISMLETSGSYNDTYKLSGSRNITGTESDRTVIDVDKRKNFTIDSWDNSSYGPWVFIVEDFSVFDKNSILSLVGSTLKNGIIYNKSYSSPGFGGKIIITNIYDMFIVYQGDYSHIEVNPYNSVLSGDSIVASAHSNLVGSTLYLSGDGWVDTFTSSVYSATNQTNYNLEIVDSVLTNLNTETSDDFSACNLYLRHNAINNVLSVVSGDFNISANDSNQYGWNPPTDYPFTKDNELYGQNIDYINNNKNKLTPFSGINIPPNPGDGWDQYEGYETGLFGHSREDYRR